MSAAAITVAPVSSAPVVPASVATVPAGAAIAAGGAAPVLGGMPMGIPPVAGKHDSASLYVGELSPEVTEAILYEHFKAIGQVASIRVCRHAVTRQSLGYAYVNYVQYADAERAIEQLNHSVIRDVPIRIMWSHRDPEVRRDNVANVYIKHLDKSIDDKQLNDTFAQFGKILSCKIQRNESTGESMGFGFVHFENEEAAILAIKTVHGLEIQGKKLYVSPFQPRRDRVEKYSNLYVKSIPKAWTNDDLKKYFAQQGEVTSAVVMVDDAGVSKGFGFVNFADPEDAAKASDRFGNKVPEGGDEPLYVSRAMKKSEREKVLRNQRSEIVAKFQGVNLYVRNFEDTLDDVKLMEAFKPYGQISSAHVQRNEKGVSRGFGFVCFATPEEAQTAITEMNGKMIGSKPIYVAIHEPKEIRKAKLAAQHQARAAQRMSAVMTPHMFPVPQPQAAMYYGQGMQRPPYMYPAQPGIVPMPRQPAGPGGPRMPFGAMSPNQGGMPHAGMRRPPQGGRGRGAPRGAMRGRGGYKGGRMDEGTHMPLNPAALAAMPEDERRVLLGNALFAAVNPKNPANSKKIVGMLLEAMDQSEIIAVLENESALDEKIQEAVESLASADH